MNNEKTETNFTTDNNWWSFCDNFLSIAKVGCLEMLNQKYPKYEEISKETAPFWKYNLYVATVFNLKHALEIFLKYLIFILKDEFPKFNNKNGHNIKYLLEIFQNECDLEKIHILITKAIKEKKESRYAIEVAEQIAKYKKEMIGDIASI
jgi:HEPN domain-containing protein